MPVFSYRAVRPDGTQVQGTVEATTLADARSFLQSGQLQVQDLASVQDAPEEVRPQAFASDPFPAWTTTEHETGKSHDAFSPPPLPEAPTAPAARKRYAPLLDTFRLYAGWLLAWYFLLLMLGGYEFTHAAPFQFPILEDFLLSPLVQKLAFAAFLFLLLSTLYRLGAHSILKAIVFVFVGLIGFAAFAVNV